MDEIEPENRSLRSSMIAGSTWMVAMRWAIRGIGVLSTVILVRLLAPEDFGLVAMSSLLVSLLGILTSFGVDMALIQRTDVERSHYDTAWTVYFLQNALVAIGLFSLSGLAAEYFQEPRVVPMMQVLSVGILFSGLQNIGVVNFRKNLQFSKEFTFMVTTKLGSFVVTIGLAVWLRNYWALIWGVVSLRVISVIMSYAMHPYRPRVSLSRFSELWSFSQWMLVRNIGMYLRTQIDTLLVARFFSTDRVGYYSVSKEIAELPTTEIIWPMARALYPGYAKLSENSSNLGSAYLKVLNSISMICIPSGFGLALVAEPLVALVFGDRWMPIVPVLTWLAIYGIILTLSSSVQSPLIALGQMRRVAAITWAQLLVAVPAILFVVRLDNLEWIALTQVLTALLIMPIFFASIITTGVVDMRGVARAVWRPLAASLVMVGCVSAIPSQLPGGLATELFAKCSIGALIFIIADLFIWVRMGKPDGGEKAMLQLLSGRSSLAKRLLD